MNKDEFNDLALAIVSEIPKGKVASYKMIAQMMGYPKHARHVGKACSQSKYYGEYPCHRIVNAQGGLVKGWDQQRELLIEEGIEFLNNGNVDMKKYAYK